MVNHSPAYAKELNNGQWVQLPLAGHGLPDEHPSSHNTNEDADLWIASSAGVDRIVQELRRRFPIKGPGVAAAASDLPIPPAEVAKALESNPQHFAIPVGGCRPGQFRPSSVASGWFEGVHNCSVCIAV